MSRVINFSDGFESASEPTLSNLEAGRIQSFASDAAFVADKGSAASAGDIYHNTATKTIRQYTGTEWVNLISGSNGDVAAATVPYINTNKQLVSSAVTPTNLATLDTTTSLTTQLAGKQATITGAATTIASSDLATSKVLVSDGSGKVAASSVTSTELGYVAGLTSSAQTQLNEKVLKSLYGAKGSLLAASAAGTPTELAASTNGYILSLDSSEATGLKWVAAGSASAGGSDGHVQYNNGGVIGGSASFVWDDTNNRLLIGYSTGRDDFFNTANTYSPAVQIEGTTYSSTMLANIRNSADAAGPYYILGKTRGATNGSTTIVQSGDSLGSLSFQGMDGTKFVVAAGIAATVDSTPGSSDMPGRLTFSTTAGGASSPTERMRIDSSGNITIGSTARLYGGTGEVTVSSQSSGVSGGCFELGSIAADASDVTIGSINFSFNDNTGAADKRIAIIRSQTEGTTANNRGSRLIFYTKTDGSSIAERMRIDSSGNVGFGLTPTSRNNTTIQIKDGIGFPATQVASSDANTLDDYEEGTWTPSLGGTSNLNIGGGRYTKIGRFVTIQCNFTVTSIGTGNTTTISGLPFTSANIGGFAFKCLITGSATNIVSAVGFNNASTGCVIYSKTAAAASDVSTNPIFQANTFISLTGTYEV